MDCEMQMHMLEESMSSKTDVGCPSSNRWRWISEDVPTALSPSSLWESQMFLRGEIKWQRRGTND